jgi:diguanylate cyclase (GGDEF)-like protein
LIIDDCEAIHHLVKARLRQEELELHCSVDGMAGIAMAQRINPDLILLDVDMPHPDGFEVCRRLKSDEKTMAIPVIFLTGASAAEQKIQGLDVGACDYITKPFDAAELRARVRATLRTKYLLDLLTNKAMIDGLTGLWNRAYFESRLNQELALARRYDHPLSCIMLDIDHFKIINDRYGHPMGDGVLRNLSEVISAGCRAEDVVCRYGGEEFAIITPNVAARGAAELAERLRDALGARAVTHRGVEVPVTCSFGVAEVHNREPSIVELADKALYRAKQLGRNRVEVEAPAPEGSPVAA